MSAGQHNFIAEVGATFEQTLAWQDADGVGLSITGKTIEMEVRACPGGDVIVEASTTDGRIVITDGANGIFAITIPANIMADVAPLSYVYDILLITSAADRIRLVEGAFHVAARVTV